MCMKTLCEDIVNRNPGTPSITYKKESTFHPYTFCVIFCRILTALFLAFTVEFICMYLYKAYFIYYQSQLITSNLFVSKMWRSSNKNMLDQCQKCFCGSYIGCHTSQLSHYTALNQLQSNMFDIGLLTLPVRIMR